MRSGALQLPSVGGDGDTGGSGKCAGAGCGCGSHFFNGEWLVG